MILHTKVYTCADGFGAAIKSQLSDRDISDLKCFSGNPPEGYSVMAAVVLPPTSGATAGETFLSIRWRLEQGKSLRRSQLIRITAMWIHGHSVIVETPESFASISKFGFGTDMTIIQSLAELFTYH